MQWTTNVISCSSNDGSYSVELEESHFHPRGGGQLADRGTIDDAKVLDVIGPVHYTDRAVFGKVECARDEKFRKQMSVLHSAEHTFMAALIRASNAELEKIALSENHGKVILTGDVSWKTIMAVESQVNDVIARALPVTVSEMAKKDVPLNVRIKRDKVPDKVKIVKIGDFDASACKGTHVANTSEIILFKVLGMNKQGEKMTIEFTAGNAALDLTRDLANNALSTAQVLGTEPEKLEATAKNLLDLSNYYHDNIRKLGREYASTLKLKTREIAGVKIVADAFPVGKDEITSLFNSAKGDNVILVSTLDGFLIAKGTGKNLAKKLTEKCGGGAGGKNTVSGAVKNTESVEKVLKSFFE